MYFLTNGKAGLSYTPNLAALCYKSSRTDLVLESSVFKVLICESILGITSRWPEYLGLKI